MPNSTFTYWTTDKGTRHELRHRRCRTCGLQEAFLPGDRLGPCPYRARHAAALRENPCDLARHGLTPHSHRCTPDEDAAALRENPGWRGPWTPEAAQAAAASLRENPDAE